MQPKGDDLLKAIIAQAVTPLLKDAGFRKKHHTFHRRHHETVQVVNLQSSPGSDPTQKCFFVNVGIAFDAVCKLKTIPILENPKEYECDDRGTRDRLENLIEECPDVWMLNRTDDQSELSARLSLRLKQLVQDVDRVDSIAAYRQHRWFERFRPVGVNAQIMYLLGDSAGARQEIVALSKLFAERKHACDASWWLKELGLPEMVLHA